MVFATIEINPNAEGSRYFDVVIKRGQTILATWNVGSEEEGRAQILTEIGRINKKYNPDVV